MGDIRRIGLIGLTGVGKSTAALYLRDVHGFQVATTGEVCRAVSRLLYGNEDKSNLLKLTDALQSIDPTIFLKSALRRLPAGERFVIAALRYTHDYDYAKQNQLYIVRITAARDLRQKRLQGRGQVFNFETDAAHASELQLSEVAVNATIENDGTVRQLYAKIDDLLNQNGASPA
jgi:dephospho-CoA kinase